MGSHRLPASQPDLLARLRRLLLAADARSYDIATLEAAITRFQSLEARRLRRKSLASARERKDAIIARLAFLAELDEMTENETDMSVFEEIALIFDEIALAAIAAAEATRAVGGGEDIRH